LIAVAALLHANPALGEEPKKAEFVLKVASIAPDGTPWSEHLNVWKSKIEKDSGGRIKIKTYWGGILGDENVTVGETKRGAISLFAGSVAALSSGVPELSVLELPYLFRNLDEVDHVLDDVLFQDAKALLYERGFVLLFWHENGWRSMATSFGFVHSPSDLKGKKMRSQEADTHLEMYRAFGASPVPIAATEVLSSLQTGVVDGFDNTPLFAFASSWYQGVKYFTVTRHIYQPGILVMSRKSFEELPADLQGLITRDPAKEAAKGRAMVRALTPMLLENFKAAGVGLEEITEAERAAFELAAKPVHAWFTKTKSKRAVAMLKKIDLALKKMRSKK